MTAEQFVSITPIDSVHHSNILWGHAACC